MHVSVSILIVKRYLLIREAENMTFSPKTWRPKYGHMIWSLANRQLAHICSCLLRGAEQRLCPLVSGEKGRGSSQLSDSRKLFWAGWEDTVESGPALVVLVASSEHLCIVWFWISSCLWSHQAWHFQRFYKILYTLLLNPAPSSPFQQAIIICYLLWSHES